LIVVESKAVVGDEFGDFSVTYIRYFKYSNVTPEAF
jgi:hypothetical protein